MLTNSQLNDRLPRTVDAQRTPDDARSPETVAMWYGRCFGEVTAGFFKRVKDE